MVAAAVAVCSAAAWLASVVVVASVDQAETLFRDGKALLAQRDYEHACPLLAASFALDPGTGTLLALSICYEGQGKLASAADGYGRVAARAGAEGRADRAEVAHERAAALAPRLSKIAIVPPEAGDAGKAGGDALADLVIRRDGVLVPPDTWGALVAVDGGSHLIEVSAAGKRPWHTTVTVSREGDQKIVAVPTLVDAATAPSVGIAAGEPAPRPAPAAATGAPPVAELATGVPSRATDSDLQPERQAAAPAGAALRITGLALLGGGVAGLLVGGGYALYARSKYQDSLRGCQENVCNDGGTSDRLAAIAAGNVATIASVAGALVAVTGATLFIVARQKAKPTTAAAWVGGGLAMTPGGAVFVLEGSLAP